jgi:phosphomannomutase
MSALRAAPPKKIIDISVETVDYLNKTGNEKTDALVFTAGSLKVIFRPSGTEPKLKCYLQFRGDAALEKLEELKDWAKATISSLS